MIPWYIEFSSGKSIGPSDCKLLVFRTKEIVQRGGGDLAAEKSVNFKGEMSLDCSNCGFHNPPGMRFCGQCGSRLPGEEDQQLQIRTQTAASKLGVLVGSDLKQRFYQAGLESAGQRRIVTVLFADLCDYTGLSGKLDDESLYDLIQDYIQMLAEKVYQFEGMVDKITGDGIMALFGAPIALENPAERAVRAALEMQAGLEELNRQLEDRLGEKLQMHWGLNRGSVIVGGVGSDLLIDYTAIGDSVNLARRLQEAALPGTILVSESVYSTTQALVDYQELPALDLKGYETGVTGFRVEGLKPTPGVVRGIQGLHAPMVGRKAELETILLALDRMCEDRRGQLVTLIGEAGIGKSRLTAEFKSQLEQDEITLLEGQSLTYRKSGSYWIFLEILRSFLGVAPGTSRAEIHEKLLVKVTRLMGSDASSVLPLLEKLLNLESSYPRAARRLDLLDAEQLRKQYFIAIRKTLLALADQKPLLLILEDLHWADEVSLDLLAFLIEAIGDRSIMILVITRPFKDDKLEEVLEFACRHLQDYCTLIHLESLSAEQSDQLLFSLLGMQDLPAGVRSQITSRASGIPFYIEETLRMLIDKQLLVFDEGSWILASEINLELEVPENLQDLILARFDRLTSDQRTLLQIASVIGREFSAELLQLVMENSNSLNLEQLLSTLEEKAFILPVAAPSFGGYMFRHVLTSDAVYHTLLRRDRSRLHGQVAGAIEQVYADQLDDQVEVLARHYLRSDYLDKALHYLILAGSKSAREYANQQALRYFEQAKHLLPEVDHSIEQACQVWLGLGDVLVFVGEYSQARSCYREILESDLLVEGDGVFSRLPVVYRKNAVTYERQGEFDKALEELDLAGSALQAGEQASPVAEAQILNDRGWILFLRGNFQESRSTLQSALELSSGSEDLGVVASINNRLGAVSYQLREYKQAATFVRKSLEIRKLLGDVSGEARLYNNLGLLGLMSGDLQEAQGNFYQSINLLENIGDTEGIALANINLGLVKYDLGDYESAGRHLDNALNISKRIGHRFYLGLASMYLGRLQTSSGEFELAEEALRQSQVIFEELGAQDNLVDALYYRAENDLAWGKMEQAVQKGETAYRSLISEETNLAPDSVQSGRVNRLLGSIARRQGDLGSSEHFLEESADIFQLASEKLESARTAYELGLLALDLEEPDQASSYFSRAKKIFMEVGAQKEMERLDFYLAAAAA